MQSPDRKVMAWIETVHVNVIVFGITKLVSCPLTAIALLSVALRCTARAAKPLQMLQSDI